MEAKKPKVVSEVLEEKIKTDSRKIYGRLVLGALKSRSTIVLPNFSIFH